MKDKSKRLPPRHVYAVRLHPVMWAAINREAQALGYLTPSAWIRATMRSLVAHRLPAKYMKRETA